MIEAERIADRHHPLADLDVIGIAQRRDRKIVLRVDFEQRDVAFRVASDQPGLVLAAILVETEMWSASVTT